MEKERGNPSPPNRQNPPLDNLSVVRVAHDEIETVARVLAEAYQKDPVLLWAMPRASTRLTDATFFFGFSLRRLRSNNLEVFATPDRSAVAVMSTRSKKIIQPRKPALPLKTHAKTESPTASFFQWIEAFRPEGEHKYLEFIGCLPSLSSRGQGSLLLRSILARTDRQGMSVWSWSSNPRNLNFYRRLGFEVGSQLQRDAVSPPIIPLWRPPSP